MTGTTAKLSVLATICFISWKFVFVQAFVAVNVYFPSHSLNGPTGTCLFAGMGKTIKKGKKSSGSSSAPFDAAASLLKMEKRYMEISAKSAKILNKDDVCDDDCIMSELLRGRYARCASTVSR